MTAPAARAAADARRGGPWRWLAGVRWYLREISGEARWDSYVARCAASGTEPMTRRAWERHRADAREHSPQSRCC